MTMWYDFKETAISLISVFPSHNQVLSLHGLLSKILPLEVHLFYEGFDSYYSADTEGRMPCTVLSYPWASLARSWRKNSKGFLLSFGYGGSEVSEKILKIFATEVPKWSLWSMCLTSDPFIHSFDWLFIFLLRRLFMLCWLQLYFRFHLALSNPGIQNFFHFPDPEL